jgi:ubiquinone/menaquinone biosynthesis C-methylase UbiE
MSEYDPLEVEQHEKSTWESVAEIYTNTAAMLTALSGQFEIVVEFGLIDQKSRVLDLGCGPGQLTDALSKVAGQVEGVDFAEQMIGVAQRTFPHLTFQVANGEQLPYDDSTFDVVVCNYTAHHFARPEVVFREILRALKPGGRVVIIHPIQTEQAGWGSFAEALCEELPPEALPGGPLLDVADPRGYETLLSRCGYADAHCERKVKPVTFPEIDQLLDAGWKVCGLNDQPQEIQDRIRAGTIGRAAKYKRPDGGYSFPDVVLVATGCRG